MILTCPQCQSQYNLESDKLGAGGRVVRCVSCSHTWFQTPPMEIQPQAAAVEPPPPPPPPQEPAVQPVPEPQPEPPAEQWNLEGHDEGINPETDQAEIFDAILTSVATKSTGKPSARQEISAAVITHNPLGVGAGMFGFLTFFLFVSTTLLVVFLAQKPITHHWPQMALLYKTLGIRLKVPGEGLRMSAVVAEQRMEDEKRVLVVEGKMTNMSEQDLPSPPLHVTLKNEERKTLKEWDLKAGGARLTSGQAAPVKLQLQDVPPDGAVIEMRVQD